MSILFICFPPDHNGLLLVCPCSSSGIHCCPMVFLPLTFAVSLASWVIHSCKVRRNCQSLESGFDPLNCFFIRSKINATRTEGQSLRYVLQAWMALDASGYLSHLVQLNVAQFVNSATWLFAELHRVFWLSPNLHKFDLVRARFLILPLHSWILSSFFPHFPRSHLVQFLQFWGRL